MAEAKKQITKRQHWLPRTSYLQQFTADGKVKTYWFTDNNRLNFLKTATQKDIAPVNVGLKKDLYEAPMLPPNAIEDMLALLEGKYGEVLERKIKLKKRLSPEDRDIVALYVSALENRTLAQQQHVNSFVDELEQKGRQLSLGHNNPKAADDWSKQMDGLREVMFAQWLAISLDVNKWGPLDFCFVSPDSYVKEKFITSDHPVTLVDYTNDNSFYGMNQWHKTAECVVPLTPDIALFGNMCGITGYRTIDYNFVREINNRVLRRADKMLISSSIIEEQEAKAFTYHNPQSLLLKLVKLPKGRGDRIIAAQKKREQEDAK